MALRRYCYTAYLATAASQNRSITDVTDTGEKLIPSVNSMGEQFVPRVIDPGEGPKYENTFGAN
jgi:hypothetical protein